jgi:hypothetical protein
VAVRGRLCGVFGGDRRPCPERSLRTVAAPSTTPGMGHGPRDPANLRKFTGIYLDSANNL